MSFRLSDGVSDNLVDQDYDTLEARLREGGHESVRSYCLELIAKPDLPDESKLWVSTLLGLSELAERRYEEALKHCGVGHGAPEPYGPRAISGMVWALMGLQRGREAYELLHSAAHQYPHSSFIFEALGMYHLGMNNHDESWRCFVKAYDISPSTATTLSNLVALGCRTERSAELLRILSRMRSEQPWNLDVRGFLAVVLMLCGDIEQVKQEVVRVSTLSPYTKVSPHVLQALKDVVAALRGSGAA